MGATPVLYLTPTGTGTVRALSTVASAAASNTKNNYPALTLAQTIRQFSPETTSNAGALPAANAAFNGIGWTSTNDVVPLSDAGVTRAGTVNVAIGIATSTGNGTVIVTVVMYVGTVEIGRGNVSQNATTTNTAFTVPVAVQAGVSIPSGAKLSIAVYTSSTNAGLSATTLNLNYPAATTNVQPVSFTINAARSATDATTTADSATRSYATTRSALEDETYVPLDSATRVAAYSRYTADAVSALLDAASRVFTSFRRTTDQSQDITDTASRSTTLSRTTTDVVVDDPATALRVTSYSRPAFEDETFVPLATASRQAVFPRTSNDSVPTFDRATSTDTFDRSDRVYDSPFYTPTAAPAQIVNNKLRYTQAVIWDHGWTAFTTRFSDQPDLAIEFTLGNSTAPYVEFQLAALDGVATQLRFTSTGSGPGQGTTQLARVDLATGARSDISNFVTSPPRGPGERVKIVVQFILPFYPPMINVLIYRNDMYTFTRQGPLTAGDSLEPLFRGRALKGFVAPPSGYGEIDNYRWSNSGQDAASRQTTFRRTNSESTGTIDTARRSLIFTRNALEDETFVPPAIASKQITYGRTSSHYFTPTDPPLSDVTRYIRGVVRLATTGDPWLGVATVYLVRESDNLVCASTTSSPVDGSYSFGRNRLDTESYYVVGQDDVNGTYEQDTSAHNLVPA